MLLHDVLTPKSDPHLCIELPVLWHSFQFFGPLLRPRIINWPLHSGASTAFKNTPVGVITLVQQIILLLHSLTCGIRILAAELIKRLM